MGRRGAGESVQRGRTGSGMHGGDADRDRFGDPCTHSAPVHPRRRIEGVLQRSKVGRMCAIPQAQTQSGWARAGAHREDGPEVVEQLDVPRDARTGPVDHVALAGRERCEQPAEGPGRPARTRRAQRDGSPAPPGRGAPHLIMRCSPGSYRAIKSCASSPILQTKLRTQR